MKDTFQVLAMRVFAQRVPDDAAELSTTSERLFTAFVIAVCGWSLIEAPLEFCSSDDSAWLLVMAASKVLICLNGVVAIANVRFAREVFAFICGASILAIAPALPIEYRTCLAVALFSTVECISKGACVAAFAIASFRST